MVQFPSNGTEGSGWFAPAASASGPAVLVIQEWWGLVPHIRDVVDRFAAAGFTALAPDLFRGATRSEPDEAGKPAEPDWSALRAPVRCHFAELDGFFGPDKVAELSEELHALGKDAELTVHPGVDHAFFNDDRPEVYSPTEATAAWDDTLDFFRSTVR